MKRFFTRYSIFLMPIIAFLIIGFALEAIICYGIRLYMINCSKNSLFSRNAVTVAVKGTDVFDFGDIGDVSIFRNEDSNAFSAYEIVCTNGRLNVGNGVNIDKDLLGTKSAIVGSEVDSFVNLSDLTIDDDKYEVKGEFTDERVPSNNCTVFYFGDNVCDTQNCEFVIDGKNNKLITSAMKQLNKKADECGAELVIIESNKIGVKNFISSRISLPILFTLYFAVLGFNDVMICIFHTEQLKRIITINVLLGRKRPAGIVFRSLILFMLISSAAISFVVWLLMDYFIDVVYSFIATVLFLGLINIVISLIYKHRMINNSSEILMELCNE